ncbi:MAG: hypothetical protein AAFV29_03880, partial [Myxococcota bacterium]
FARRRQGKITAGADDSREDPFNIVLAGAALGLSVISAEATAAGESAAEAAGQEVIDNAGDTVADATLNAATNAAPNDIVNASINAATDGAIESATSTVGPTFFENGASPLRSSVRQAVRDSVNEAIAKAGGTLAPAELARVASRAGLRAAANEVADIAYNTAIQQAAGTAGAALLSSNAVPAAFAAAPHIRDAFSEDGKFFNRLTQASVKAWATYTSGNPAFGNERGGTFDPTWNGVWAGVSNELLDFFNGDDFSLLDIGEVATGIGIHFSRALGGRTVAPGLEDDFAALTTQTRNLIRLNHVFTIADTLTDPDPGVDQTTNDKLATIFDTLAEEVRLDGIGTRRVDRVVETIGDRRFVKADNIVDDTLGYVADFFRYLDENLDPLVGWRYRAGVYQSTQDYIKALNGNNARAGLYLELLEDGSTQPVLIQHVTTPRGDKVTRVATESAVGEGFDLAVLEELRPSLDNVIPPPPLPGREDARLVMIPDPETGRSYFAFVDPKNNRVLAAYAPAGFRAGKLAFAEVPVESADLRGDARFVLRDGTLSATSFLPKGVTPSRGFAGPQAPGLVSVPDGGFLYENFEAAAVLQIPERAYNRDLQPSQRSRARFGDTPGQIDNSPASNVTIVRNADDGGGIVQTDTMFGWNRYPVKVKEVSTDGSIPNGSFQVYAVLEDGSRIPIGAQTDQRVVRYSATGYWQNEGREYLGVDIPLNRTPNPARYNQSTLLQVIAESNLALEEMDFVDRQGGIVHTLRPTAALITDEGLPAAAVPRDLNFNGNMAMRMQNGQLRIYNADTLEEPPAGVTEVMMLPGIRAHDSRVIDAYLGAVETYERNGGTDTIATLATQYQNAVNTTGTDLDASFPAEAMSGISEAHGLLGTNPDDRILRSKLIDRAFQKIS